MTNPDQREISYKTTSFRAEASLIDSARKIFDAHGLSVSAAITLFFEETVKQGRIPEVILNTGSNVSCQSTANDLLQEVTTSLRLPDYANPVIPSRVFAEEIVKEFADGIFCDCKEPWIDLAKKVISLSFWNPENDDEAFCYLNDCLPKKLPYDYALEIVEEETQAWIQAAHDAEIGIINSPFGVIMGRILKRSHLSLNQLMDELMRYGAVDQKDGDSFNRSKGRMIEELVSSLKRDECWLEPAPTDNLSYKRISDGLIEETIDKLVEYHTAIDWSKMPSFEHPFALILENGAFEMSSNVRTPYELMYKGSYDWKVEDALMSIYETCKFTFPVKSFYDECIDRYLKTIREAAPGSLANQSIQYANAPFELLDESFYPIAVDMDVHLWAELYSRELFLMLDEAIESGMLPKPKQQ